MKPSRFALILMLIGMVLLLIGVSFKLNHLMGAETVFNGGVVSVVMGVFLWIIGIIRTKGVS